MAVPAACFLGVMATCLLGIIIGSFYDFRINEMLANKTSRGGFSDAVSLKLAFLGGTLFMCPVCDDTPARRQRPRYKYLITLDDPISQFRSWWQMVPNLAGSDDSFKSWPSGNMTNHFLSDVCFGTLITYIIYAVVSEAFLSAARAN